MLTYPVQSGGRFFTRGNVRGYCFGFNGQEKDDEVYGEDNTYAFEYRIHDARLGRFLSVDPLAQEYPWNSTYAFAENDVIRFIDLEGKEKAMPSFYNVNTGYMTSARDNARYDNPAYYEFNSPASKIATARHIEQEQLKENRTKAMGTLKDGSDMAYAREHFNMQNLANPYTSLSVSQNAFEGYSLVSTPFELNRFAAIGYLAITKNYKSFATVEGFTLQFGSTAYKYNRSLTSAINGSWSTSTRFSTSAGAVERLALRYEGSKNFAQVGVQVKNFGLFVKGTAAPQTTSLGGGIQFLRVPSLSSSTFTKQIPLKELKKVLHSSNP